MYPQFYSGAVSMLEGYSVNAVTSANFPSLEKSWDTKTWTYPESHFPANHKTPVKLGSPRAMNEFFKYYVNAGCPQSLL